MATVNITEAAAAELKRIWEEQQLPSTAKLLLALRGSPCSGIQYVLNIVEKVDDKYVVENVGGIEVAVEKASVAAITGTTLDFYADTNKRGFVFNAPGTPAAPEKCGGCGCGSSCAK